MKGNSMGYLPLNCPLEFVSSAVLSVPLPYVTHLEGVIGVAAVGDTSKLPRSARVGRMVKPTMLDEVRGGRICKSCRRPSRPAATYRQRVALEMRLMHSIYVDHVRPRESAGQQSDGVSGRYGGYR